MSYGLNLGWGGPIGDYIGFWGDYVGLWGAYSGIRYRFSPGLIWDNRDYRRDQKSPFIFLLYHYYRVGGPPQV